MSNTRSAAEFECTILKYILLRFGNHCDYNRQRVEVCNAVRYLCYHQLISWNNQMVEAANKYFYT